MCVCVCVYKLVKLDGEDGKTTAELVRRSVCKFPDTLHINLHEAHFPCIQDVRMYCHSYRCRKCGDSLWKYASKLRQHESTCTGAVRRVYPDGVYHSTHWCSNVWTTRTSECPNRCGTIHTEPPLTLSVGSTPNNFRRTVTTFTGLHVTSR